MLIDNIYAFYALVILMAYLLGSIPCGLVLGKLMGAGDIRKIGSGNIGATNALRTGNKKLAIFTLLGDVLKGSLAVWIAFVLNMELADGVFIYAPVIAGIVSVLGHIFPVWLKFKGGKGVATTIGVILILNWMVGLGFLVTWLVTARLSRYSSLGAIIAALHAPLYAAAYGNHGLVLPFAIMALILIITHRGNIKRLLRGEESVIQLKKA
ncbi:MAG TPA: glycerol-3-phosphate 1-O-acyltransferase PlsY [Alphaproteobacteria bacterium]